MLETGYGTEEADADCLDALAEALYSVSQELLSQQIIHSIGWQNHEENTFQCVEVETEEDLNALLPELLGAVPGRDGMSVADHYMESRGAAGICTYGDFFTGASGEPGRIGKSVYSDGSDLFRRGSRV